MNNVINWSLPDINECEATPCANNSHCMNVPGSFICLCPEGFFGDGVVNCTGEEMNHQLVGIEPGVDLQDNTCGLR